MRKKKNPLDRLLAKTEIPEDRSKCWIWLGGKTASGHGAFWYEGKTVTAHRLSWILHKGAIPQEKFVFHACKKPNCINPDHLILGDEAMMREIAVELGRKAIAKKHPRIKLTNEQRLEIKSLYDGSDLTTKEIGRKFGISGQHVSKIGRGKFS